ncbi:MAG: Na+/H+ antiporter NhaA [Microbacteriaceae bacterium]
MVDATADEPVGRTVRLVAFVSKDSVGGTLLLIATVIALILANSGMSEWYFDLRDTRLGPAALHLNLSVGQWASDGLLALFFFVVGLELKREFVSGELHELRRAILPVIAAVGGVVTPAIIFVIINANAGGDALRGWAIPTATDIAFALAALAAVSTHLPIALRSFLLTLAVVDDLLAIGIIAFFYAHDLEPGFLLLAALPLALFGILVQHRVRAWYLLLPLGLATWALVHASGIHSTVAGVLLAFTVPVLQKLPLSQKAPARANSMQHGRGLAQELEDRLRPLSALIAVPVFAFFSAGVAVGGFTGLGAAFGDSVAIGVVVALVVGKTVGIFGSTFIVAKSTGAVLDESLRWIDMFGLAVLAGLGFTVSLLVGELAFGIGSVEGEHAKIGILVGSTIAAVLGALILSIRNLHYRRAGALRNVDGHPES